MHRAPRFFGPTAPGDLSDARLLAIANPAIGDAQAEVEAITAPLSRAASTPCRPSLATKEDVRSRIGDYDRASLGARHIRSRQPLFSPIQRWRRATAMTAGSPPQRCSACRLDRAWLVVLSACETGKASVANGDETVGMIRGLLFAGARSFVLSRWKVDAASTSLWMRTFYTEAQTNPDGRGGTPRDPRGSRRSRLSASLFLGAVHACRPMSQSTLADEAIRRLRGRPAGDLAWSAPVLSPGSPSPLRLWASARLGSRERFSSVERFVVSCVWVSAPFSCRSAALVRAYWWCSRLRRRAPLRGLRRPVSRLGFVPAGSVGLCVSSSSLL